MQKQVFNPFLPLWEYIPDGEPHLFGGRVYLYGSHDREGGWTFCMDDYTVWSAPEDDLSDWRCEGVIYRAEQDPMYPEMKYMYAPDVVQGNDGRYYLYYCMSGDYGVGGYCCPISVAVSDTPAGSYTYLGHVQNPDGTPLMRYVCFDPAVMNDNGVIRLYYGTQYGYEEEQPGDPQVIETEMEMFGRTREEILSYPDSINGPVMAVLEDDMLTVKEQPRHIIPYKVKGTSFEEHPFFEASSMRKVGEKYYFVYSSWQNHELCYAVSDHPDRDFTFGGTIVSNGDIGVNGRTKKDRLNMTGTTHGSILSVRGQWYVFYHRLTHKSDYSRQACAEKIEIAADGSIRQAEITSCGLNDGPLRAEGSYPAVICCNLTNGNMPHGCNSIYREEFPNVTHGPAGTSGEEAGAADGKKDQDVERFIGEIEEGSLIGYKYFRFEGVKEIGITARIETPENHVVYSGPVRVDERSAEPVGGVAGTNATDADPGAAADYAIGTDSTIGMSSAIGADSADGDFGAETEVVMDVMTEIDGPVIGRIRIRQGADPMHWETFYTETEIPDGVYAVFFRYHGDKKLQMKDILFR